MPSGTVTALPQSGEWPSLSAFIADTFDKLDAPGVFCRVLRNGAFGIKRKVFDWALFKLLMVEWRHCVIVFFSRACGALMWAFLGQRLCHRRRRRLAPTGVFLRRRWEKAMTPIHLGTPLIKGHVASITENSPIYRHFCDITGGEFIVDTRVNTEICKPCTTNIDMFTVARSLTYSFVVWRSHSSLSLA